MRVHSKSHLLNEIDETWQQLWDLIDQLEPKQIEKRTRLTESSPARSINDALAHVYAWQLLFLDWYQQGLKGAHPDLPAKGFQWNQTPQLNQVLFEEWKNTPYPSIRRRLKLSHRRVRELANRLSEKQLLEVGQFAWTGKLSLAKYLAASTASHYRWAIKSTKRIVKKNSIR